MDKVEEGGRLPAWTQKENALFSVVLPAVCSWRSGSLHPPAGFVRHGPAARPRLVFSTDSEKLSLANSAAVYQEY